MRPLPRRQNPMVLPNATPDYEELRSRRRLGKTDLSVEPDQVGTSNATKPENLGMFEYAHLWAPLPRDLTGSEIFESQMNQPKKKTYFLVRRSKDGYVSATGMFKIAFPWAKHAEERLEREHLKSKELTSPDEIAGNVWIPPETALELAAEYNILSWVRALLDPEAIRSQSPDGRHKEHISPPPKFDLPASAVLPPPSIVKPSRSRRSASPTKIASPSKKITSPRKPRQTKAMKEANAANASAASAALQSTLEAAASTAESESVVAESVAASADATADTTAEEAVGGAVDSSADSPKVVKVEVDSAVDVSADGETTRTSVLVEMPVGLPELPLPEDTDKMIQTAKEMVDEARKLEAESSRSPPRKRKSDEVDSDDLDSDLPAQPTKRARVLEEKLKRQRVRTRAFIGISATLAIGAAIPYLTTVVPNLFG